MNRNPDDPRPRPPSSTGLAEWMRQECVIDHAGTEESFRLTVGRDGLSFHLVYIDGSERTVQVDSEMKMEFVYPSLEGTVILCQMMSGGQRFYDSRTGRRLKPVELKKINPHFLT